MMSLPELIISGALLLNPVGGDINNTAENNNNPPLIKEMSYNFTVNSNLDKYLEPKNWSATKSFLEQFEVNNKVHKIERDYSIIIEIENDGIEKQKLEELESALSKLAKNGVNVNGFKFNFKSMPQGLFGFYDGQDINININKNGSIEHHVIHESLHKYVRDTFGHNANNLFYPNEVKDLTQIETVDSLQELTVRYFDVVGWDSETTDFLPNENCLKMIEKELGLKFVPFEKAVINEYDRLTKQSTKHSVDISIFPIKLAPSYDSIKEMGNIMDDGLLIQLFNESQSPIPSYMKIGHVEDSTLYISVPKIEGENPEIYINGRNQMYRSPEEFFVKILAQVINGKAVSQKSLNTQIVKEIADAIIINPEIYTK